MAYKTFAVLMALLAVAAAFPFAPRCGCSQPKPTCFRAPPACQQTYVVPSKPACQQTYVVPSKPACQQTYVVPSQPACQQTFVVPSKPACQQTVIVPQTCPQTCHQKVQVPVTSYINEEIDVPVEVVENIPVAEENADYQKDEREFRADAHAFEEGHSRYQRWEDADAGNRHVQERGCSHAHASMIPIKRCENKRVDIQVPVEEMVEIEVEVPQPVVKTCGCNRCAQNLPCQQTIVVPQPTITAPCGCPKTCGCPKPSCLCPSYCGCNKYFF